VRIEGRCVSAVRYGSEVSLHIRAKEWDRPGALEHEPVVLYPADEGPVADMEAILSSISTARPLYIWRARDGTHRAAIAADEAQDGIGTGSEKTPGDAIRALRAKLEGGQRKPVEVMTDAMKLAELHRAGCRIEDMTWLSNEQVSLRIRQGHRGWVDDYKAASISEALNLAVRDIREEEA